MASSEESELASSCLPESKLLKLLCLHGYRQNGDVFKQKLGALRKALKKHAELYFVTAPNKISSVDDSLLHSGETQNPNDLSSGEQKNEQCGWWFSSEKMTFDSKKPSDVCLGFEKSLNLIEKTFKEQGPFDGLLGFSQGASFVGILCGMQETNWFSYEFHFAIMVAGFKSLCHPHLNYYIKESSVPSLHVYGETDNIISRDLSELLLEQFINKEIILHPGGHFVPASGPQKQGIISFLEKCKNEMEEAERRKQKQFQLGSYVLERIDDSDIESGVNSEGNSSNCLDEDSSDIKEEKVDSTKTKQSKLGEKSKQNIVRQDVDENI